MFWARQRRHSDLRCGSAVAARRWSLVVKGCYYRLCFEREEERFGRRWGGGSRLGGGGVADCGRGVGKVG